MSNRAKREKPWHPKEFALYWAMLGFLVSIVHSYVHAFWSPPLEDHLLTHILGRLTLFTESGAAGLAAVAAIRNWLTREYFPFRRE